MSSSPARTGPTSADVLAIVESYAPEDLNVTEVVDDPRATNNLRQARVVFLLEDSDGPARAWAGASAPWQSEPLVYAEGAQS